MPAKTKTSARRIGRPPAGARDGEKVKDYPQVSVRLPPDIKERLGALSRFRGEPQWRVIAAAIACYFAELSTAERQAIERIHSRRSPR